MDNRREFFAKLIATGAAGVLPAIKQSIPEAETHKLDKDAIYIMVLPMGFSVECAFEIQKYLDTLTPDIPKILVMPLGEIQLYKL